MHQNPEAEPRQIPKSTSDVLCNHYTGNQTNGIDQSVSSSSNDSGCNSIGSETLLDHTEDRARAEGTASDDVSDSSPDDSGCYHPITARLNVDTAACSVRGSTSKVAEPLDIDDQTESKQVPDDVTKKHAGKDNKCEISSNPAIAVILRSSKIHAAKDNQSDIAEISGSPSSVVKRRGAAGKCPHRRHSATDPADSRGRVVTRRLRRTSMMVRPPQQQQQLQQQADRITRTRRRHSFMLPNGSDVYPTTRFSAGFTWPTIVEEDTHLTNADSADLTMKRKCTGDAEKDTKRNSSLADLRAFSVTLSQQQKLADVESAKLDRAPSGSTISDSTEDGVVSADFLQALGTKLSGSLQLADAAECGLANSGQAVKEREVVISDGFEEGTSVDVSVLGPGQAWENCPGGTPSPSPPTARRPPSYGQALLYKALRRSDVTHSAAEKLTTDQQTSLAAVCSPGIISITRRMLLFELFYNYIYIMAHIMSHTALLYIYSMSRIIHTLFCRVCVSFAIVFLLSCIVFQCSYNVFHCDL